jgi:hypothetical protein
MELAFRWTPGCNGVVMKIDSIILFYFTFFFLFLYDVHICCVLA